MGWMIAAYLVAATILTGYIVSLSRKTKAISREIVELRKRLG